MFTAALVTVAKMWKQPKFALTDEEINQTWATQTLEYHWALKRKGIPTQAVTCMNHEDLVLSEISWSQKGEYCMIPVR